MMTSEAKQDLQTRFEQALLDADEHICTLQEGTDYSALAAACVQLVVKFHREILLSNMVDMLNVADDEVLEAQLRERLQERWEDEATS